MKRPGIWFEVVALSAAVACASAIALAIVSGTAAIAVARPDAAIEVDSSDVAAPQPATLVGVVTDSTCGARHMKTDMTAAECTRDCQRKGAKYQLATTDKSYVLNGKPGEVDRLAGQRVQVVGALDGNVVLVKSIAIVR